MSSVLASLFFLCTFAAFVVLPVKMLETHRRRLRAEVSAHPPLFAASAVREEPDHA